MCIFAQQLTDYLTISFSSSTFHLFKSALLLFYCLPLMQSDSLNWRRLPARHDKQYWGWLSAKCAAEAVRLSLYSILESDSSLLRSLIPLLVSAQASMHTWTHKHAQSYCMRANTHGCPQSLSDTQTQPGWKMHAVNFQLGLLASFLALLLSRLSGTHTFPQP